MDVILKEDVEKLGDAGQKVNVAGGYARNYLLPQGLAIEATEAALKLIEDHMKTRAKRLAELKGDALAQAAELEKLTLTFTKKSAEEGKLFGSVTPAEIGEAIIAKGFQIDKKKIQLDNPIKAVGEVKVGIKLHPEVVANVTIIVTAEQEEASIVVVEEETAPAEEAAPVEESGETAE